MKNGFEGVSQLRGVSKNLALVILFNLDHHAIIFGSVNKPLFVPIILPLFTRYLNPSKVNRSADSFLRKERPNFPTETHVASSESDKRLTVC